MASNPLKYSDIIQPDDSISKLIAQLSTLVKANDDVCKAISETKEQAKTLSDQVKKNTYSTDEQRNAILEAEKQAEKLLQTHKRLKQAQSDTAREIALVNKQIEETNSLNKLTAQLNNSVEGSYNRLSAQYSINKIQLNKMSAAERENTASGKLLVKQTKEIYQEMIRLQETTGKHALSVGNYAKSWDGMGNAVAQLTRELPALTVSTNTFFLAISNNLPALADAIKKAKNENAELAKEGKKGIPVWKQLASSFFSWNTVLSIAITLLTVFGSQIVDWVKGMFKSKDAIDANIKSLKEFQERVGEIAGQNIAEVEALSMAWKKLGDNLGAKTKFIDDNQEAFNRLGISINSVSDAENVFDKNKDKFIESLRVRAMAAAAMELASEDYKKAVEKMIEAEAEPDEIAVEEKAVDLKTGTLQKTGKTIMERNRKKDNSLIEAKKFETDGALKLNAVATFKERHIDILNKANIPTKTENKLSDHKNNELVLSRQAQDAKLESMQDGFDKEYLKIKYNYDRQIEALREKLNTDKNLTEVSEKNLNEIINSLEVSRQSDIQKLKNGEIILNRQMQREIDEARLSNMPEGFEKERALLKNKYKNDIEDLTNKLKDDQTLTVEQEEVLTQILIEKQIALNNELNKLDQEQKIKSLQVEKETMEAELSLLDAKSDAYLKKRKEIIKKSEEIELAVNSAKPKDEQKDPSIIGAVFTKQSNDVDNQKYNNLLELAKLEQDTEIKSAQEKRKNEKELQIMRKNNEIELLRLRLENDKTLTEEQKKNIEANIAAATAEVEVMKSEKRDIYDVMGLKLDDKQKDVINESTQFALDAVNNMMARKIELAEEAVEASRRETDEADKNLDRELEARNAGYASNVEGARKEYEEAKQMEEKAIKDKEKLQKQQVLIDTATQASSLITATANIWAGNAGIPIVGTGLAIAATALMWGSFAASKVQAMKATKKYADGGLEFLNGGSHASGRDIPIGMTYDGKERRAEGGEALAIINKASTQKYRHSLPAIIKSINRGTFENSYLSFLDSAHGSLSIIQQPQTVNTETIEKHLEAIKEQGEHRYYNDADGNLIEIKGNVKTIYKNGKV